MANNFKNTRNWENIDIEAFMKMWNDGMSASLISERIGMSRCAIVGKVRRLRENGYPMREASNNDRAKLSQLARKPVYRVVEIKPKPDTIIKTLAKPKPVAKPAKAPTVPRKPPQPAIREVTNVWRPNDLEQSLTVAQKGRAMIEKVNAALPGEGIPLLDLGRYSCRFITAETPEYLYCGATVEGKGSYCDACRKRMYVAPSVRKMA